MYRRSSWATPADSAEYAASVSSFVLMPYALESPRMSSVSWLNSSPVPENSVLTLAIPASKSEVLPRVSEMTFPIPRATKAFLNVDPRDFASEDPEDFPALSASPFITFSS